MTLPGPAQRLTVILGVDATWQRKPIYTEIVHRAPQAGLAGPSVCRGARSRRASNHAHSTRIHSMFQDLPVAVVIIDAAYRITKFLPQLDELVTQGLVVIDDLHVHRYLGRRAPR